MIHDRIACWWRRARGCCNSSAATAAGASRAPSFPGVAVTAALADARDGTLYAMLKHGHFGSKLHRSDDGGANLDRARRRRPFPPMPRVRRRCSRSGRWRPAAPTSRAGCGPARCRPGCSCPPTAASIGSQVERAVERAGAREMVRRRLRRCRHSLRLARSARSRPRVRRDLLRRRLGVARRRRELDAARRRAGRRLYAAGAAGQKETAGPASRGALRCRARCDVDAASLRHLPLDRRRRDLDAAQAAGGRFRLRGRRASEGPAHRLVRARHQGRTARAARRRAWR